MSRNSRSLQLQGKICELDARYDGKKNFAPTSFGSAASRWRERRHPYLCEIYRTGATLRRAVGSLAVRKTIPIPDELLAMLSPPIRQSVTIPNELLFPKPKRGRPRHDALRRKANDLRCSLRHARRLLGKGKPRQRNREHQPDDVIEAIQARQKRAALVREMKEEAVMSYLNCAISRLRREEFTINLVRRLVKQEKGLIAPVLIVTIAMGSKPFHIAAKLLGVSQATIYRACGSRLGEFRRRGRDLLALAVVDPAKLKLPKRKRAVVSRPRQCLGRTNNFSLVLRAPRLVNF